MSELRVPLHRWGGDHWSTLAYLETRCVDYNGVVENSHMRTTSKRHPTFLGKAQRRSMMPDRDYPTMVHADERNAGTEIPDHDDWDCLVDLAHAGFLKIMRPMAWGEWLVVEPGQRGPLRVGSGPMLTKPQVVRVQFTDTGREVAGKLRAWMSGKGQSTKNFHYASAQ